MWDRVIPYVDYVALTIDFLRIKKKGEYVYYWVMMDTSEPDASGYIM